MPSKTRAGSIIVAQLTCCSCCCCLLLLAGDGDSRRTPQLDSSPRTSILHDFAEGKNAKPNLQSPASVFRLPIFICRREHPRTRCPPSTTLCGWEAMTKSRYYCCTSSARPFCGAPPPPPPREAHFFYRLLLLSRVFFEARVRCVPQSVEKCCIWKRNFASEGDDIS